MRLIQPRGNPVAVALIVQRNQFVAQNTVRVFHRRGSSCDNPYPSGVRPVPMATAIEAVEGLGPPSVQHGKVKATVEDHFLTAGAGGLQWPPWVVEPNVDALHQEPADI